MGRVFSKLCQYLRKSSTKVYKEDHKESYYKSATIIKNNEDGYETEPKKHIEIVPLQTCHVKWKLGSLIGQGSYARVFMGLQENGRMIAVKQIDLDYLDKVRFEAFKQEIDILKSLQHENIVKYYDCETKSSQLNIILEYLAGGSIASILKKFGKFNEQIIQRYLKDILNGLVYLHDCGVIHRDIKGANILVDNKGVCKLADFGCSIYASEAYSLKGTPNWMAPETINQQMTGRQSDIWSLGCLIIEMLTARPPWGHFSNPIQALLVISTKTSGPEIPPDTSDDLKDFLEKCLQFDPKLRSTARQLQEHKFMRNQIIKIKNHSQVSKEYEDLQVRPINNSKQEFFEFDLDFRSGHSSIDSALKKSKQNLN